MDPMYVVFIGGAVLSVMGWFIKQILDKVKELDVKLNEHILLDTRVQTEISTKLDIILKNLGDENELRD